MRMHGIRVFERCKSTRLYSSDCNHVVERELMSVCRSFLGSRICIGQGPASPTTCSPPNLSLLLLLLPLPGGCAPSDHC